jgi:carbamoyltransferase
LPLGHRSVVARPDRPELRDLLNLILKQWIWYQPFCLSMMETEARSVLADYKSAPNRQMTTAYTVRPAHRAAFVGVMSIDGSCPQVGPDDNPNAFPGLLGAMRARIGFDAVLNTSSNIRGQPLVCTPVQAVNVLLELGGRLAGDWSVSSPRPFVNVTACDPLNRGLRLSSGDGHAVIRGVAPGLRRWRP